MSTKAPENTYVNRWSQLFTIGGLSLLIVVGVVVSSLLPNRSVVAFCESYKKENAHLEKSKGSAYSVKPFTHSSSNPKDFAGAFTELQKVAPKDIEPDVKTLKQIFEEIDKDPSQALSASLSGLSAESSVDSWTSRHCK